MIAMDISDKAEKNSNIKVLKIKQKIEGAPEGATHFLPFELLPCASRALNVSLPHLFFNNNYYKKAHGRWFIWRDEWLSVRGIEE